MTRQNFKIDVRLDISFRPKALPAKQTRDNFYPIDKRPARQRVDRAPNLKASPTREEIQHRAEASPTDSEDIARQALQSVKSLFVKPNQVSHQPGHQPTQKAQKLQRVIQGVPSPQTTFGGPTARLKCMFTAARHQQGFSVPHEKPKHDEVLHCSCPGPPQSVAPMPQTVGSPYSYKVLCPATSSDPPHCSPTLTPSNGSQTDILSVPELPPLAAKPASRGPPNSRSLSIGYSNIRGLAVPFPSDVDQNFGSTSGRAHLKARDRWPTSSPPAPTEPFSFRGGFRNALSSSLVYPPHMNSSAASNRRRGLKSYTVIQQGLDDGHFHRQATVQDVTRARKKAKTA